MLDLLGRREEAPRRYREVSTMEVEGRMQNGQFGINCYPPACALERMKTPFMRIENNHK